MTEHRLEGLRLYDTMTGAVRDFTPVRPGHASIYLCGATVQGLPHIGHVRSGVAFDEETGDPSTPITPYPAS